MTQVANKGVRTLACSGASGTSQKKGPDPVLIPFHPRLGIQRNRLISGD